jgi:D-glycero-alpha-D-manno-heptose-7-phosphate kinase
MIITRTPYRISLFGGGSDHPAWFKEHGGKVISFTIDKYCYLTARILPPFFEHNYRIAYSIVEMVKNFNDIRHPVIRESIRKYAPNSMLEIHHHGDLPARSGVGSSSAFTVGVIHALLELQNQPVTSRVLADLSIEMEQEILKENVGWQDQIACAVGGLNYLEFTKDRTWKKEALETSKDYRNALESRLVLVYTGISRNSSDVSLGLLRNLPTKIFEMNELMSFVDICHEHLKKNLNLDIIGELLDESWKLKKLINDQSTTPELDQVYSEGKKAGAIGGKVIGAGGGGFFLFWLREGKAEEFKERFTKGTLVPVRLSFGGSKVVYNPKYMNSQDSL